MRPWRFPVGESALQRGAAGRADRLGNFVDRPDPARPRMDLLLRRSGELVGDDPVRGAIMAPNEMVEAYAETASFAVVPEEVRWFRAFAGYRFGVITCFNVMLHRRGKRHDPLWLETAKSAPRMFEHGLEVLG